MPPEVLSKRNMYKTLSHGSMQMGCIGFLQTVSTIPVCAGDSFELSMSTKLRLSPLVREMMVDVQFEQFVFFVPTRFFSTAADWYNFCTGPASGGVTLPTYTVANAGVACCGQNFFPAGSAVNTYWLAGLVRIWNEYFREPSDATGILPDNYLSLVTTESTHQWYGLPCTRLLQNMNSGVQGRVDLADQRFSIVAGDKIDLTTMAQQQGILAGERRREFYSNRYRDWLRNTFGTYANTDLDQRPTLCMRTKHKISGYDTDGTTIETMGFNRGKGIGDASLYMPMKLMPEPGLLWVLQLVRFPTFHGSMVHYLARRNATAKELLGDPIMLGDHEPPIDHQAQDFYWGSSDTTIVDRQPYANWLRTHPNVINRKLYEKFGYPTLQKTLNTFNLAHYHQYNDYEHCFLSRQFEDWKTQNILDITVLRHLQGGQASIQAGVN